MTGSQQVLLLKTKNIRPWNVPIPACHCSVLIGIHNIKYCSFKQVQIEADIRNKVSIEVMTKKMIRMVLIWDLLYNKYKNINQ